MRRVALVHRGLVLEVVLREGIRPIAVLALLLHELPGVVGLVAGALVVLYRGEDVALGGADVWMATLWAVVAAGSVGVHVDNLALGVAHELVLLIGAKSWTLMKLLRLSVPWARGCLALLGFPCRVRCLVSLRGLGVVVARVAQHKNL